MQQWKTLQAHKQFHKIKKSNKMPKNILILSAGRRVELVKAFQESCKKISPESLVYTADINPGLSSACQTSDHSFLVPRISDTSYIASLAKIQQENDIAIIIPTIDTELLKLANNRASFCSDTLIVSNDHIIASCRDKRDTATLFSQLNIESPRIYQKEDLIFPCFCKPYDGSSSIGAFAIHSHNDITPEILNNPKNMYMELIGKDFSEYTIDAYYDKRSTLKCLVPRKRIEVRAGEVSKGVTRKNFVYDYLLERIKHIPGAIGCITIQLFVNESTREIRGLEINPRFGGGYPLSYAAGADYQSWLIKEYILQEDISFFDQWEDNLLMLRYDAKILVHHYA